MTRRAARVDANQSAIVAKLRKVPGVTVQHLHMVGQGVPDILVGWMGKNYLMEIKDGDKPPSKRKLTPDERKWIARWAGQVCVVNNYEDALIALGIGLDPAPF